MRSAVRYEEVETSDSGVSLVQPPSGSASVLIDDKIEARPW